MWPRIVNAVLGIWLMAAPAVLRYGPPASTNDRIVGPIVASLAIIAIWEPTRPLRWINVLLGAWLLLAPWILGYEGSAETMNSLFAGFLIVGFALIRGRIKERYGGGWSYLWSPDQSAEDDQ